MKKVLAACIVWLLACNPAFAGVLAFDDLGELSGADMNSVTAQAGITIDMSVEVTGGYVAYGDTDGTDGTNPAYVTLSGMQIHGPGGLGYMDVKGTQIDAGTDGGTSYVQITLPDITGTISFDAIRLGPEPDTGGSLGSLYIGDLSLSGSTVKVYAH